MADSTEYLNNALDKIQSDRLKDRDDGLKDLKHALNQSRSSGRNKKFVTSQSIHAACEKLFRTVSSERSTYVRATKSNVKVLSANRLSSCAAAIRLMIEVFVTSMRLKTVLAALGHITQSLPTADGGFCAPLALDFFKTLNIILDYQPHVEHLDHYTWSKLVSFCIDSLGIYAEDAWQATTSANNGADGDSSLRTASFARAKRHSQDNIENSVQLVKCLRSLTVASNCHLLHKGQDILRAVFAFIKDSSSTTTAHNAAFETINTCLKVFSTHSRRVMSWASAEVLPLIRNLWLKKNLLLRDEMLTTLVHIEAHLVSLGQQLQSETLLSAVEMLLETMSAEYFETRERGHLALDQIALYTLETSSLQSMPMQCSTFALRKAVNHTEHNWTVVHFLALFVNWVDAQRAMHVNQHPDDDERSSKRLRTSSRLFELTTYATTPSNPEKLMCSLQILAFAIDRRLLTKIEWASVSECLIRNASHENGDVSSWALIAVASCAFPLNEEFNLHDDLWLKVWNLATRLISSIPHSRAACHVLDVLICAERVNFDDVADSIDSLIASVSLNGPALLSDSALSMWLTISHLISTNSPAQAADAAHDKMLEWLCSSWRPSDFENRSYSYQLTRDTSILSLTSAFVDIIGRSLFFTRGSMLSSLATIGEAWLFQRQQRPLTDYLLLATSDMQNFRSASHETKLAKKTSNKTFEGRDKPSLALLRFLISEAEKTRKAWHEIKTNRSSTINEDMMQIVFTLCILGTLVGDGLKATHPERAADLLSILGDLTKAIVSHASESMEPGKLNILLRTVAPILPRLATDDGTRELSALANSLSTILDSLVQTCEHQRNGTVTVLSGNEMELDDLGFGNQSGNYDRRPVSRRQDVASCDERSFIDSTAAYVYFLSCLSQEASETLDVDEIPASFVEHIMSLGPEDLIATRPLMRMMLSSKFILRSQDVGNLLEFLYESLMDPYEWNRCEVALGLCMDVMTGTAHLWTDSSLVEIADLGAQFYEWFVETASESGILSTTSQLGISDLLYTLLRVNPNYAERESKPSVRTRLFQILKGGDLVVQYHISQRLVGVFNSFVLSQHELIFDDIFESLPNDIGHPEGIYVRMLVLTQIGSVWKNLLRRCLFHILETAGPAPESLSHATHCVQLITSTLGLVNSKRLFRLFSPQLLHTWLELHPLKSISYPIFGYPNLKSMLEDAEAQFFSQLLIIGSEDKINDFETQLGLPIKDVLERSFGQAAAYGIAKDLNMHGPGGAQSHASEARMRDTLGKQRYLELLGREFPEIIGHLLVRLELEESIEKTLAKRPEYSNAANIFETIKSISHSNTTLSQIQQPSFKLKLVLDAIDRLCRRTNKKAIEIWTAALILRVARMLVDDANVSFGPLHACRTIQRLRLLVSFAGSAATTGYTLEMLIHALRPFATYKQCADDAVGLIQYLMDCGKNHLLRNPRFVAGTSLMLMLSLRDFLNSSQDSTTQGAQHRATLSTAQNFRLWLGQYVESYNSRSIEPEALEKLHAMIYSAQHISGSGTAVAETHESSLLIHLLDDSNYNDEILGEKFAFECMKLLCKDFSVPSSFREDVLGKDDTAFPYASAIWRTLRVPNASSSYLYWAAGALGRSYGYGGYVDPEIIQETNLKDLCRFQHQTSSRHAWESKSSIIRSLVEILWDDRPEIVGMAETALQQIIAEYGHSGQSLIIEKAVPNTVIDHFSSDPFSVLYPEATTHLKIMECFPATEKTFQVWITDLTVAIAASASEEPLLKAITPLLHAVDGLGEKLLPFILHTSLLVSQSETVGLSHSDQISEGFNRCLGAPTQKSRPHLQSLLNAALYLRTQPHPQEQTILDRQDWLTLDLSALATVACFCKMFKTALLFVELSQSMDDRNSSKTSSMTNVSANPKSMELLVSIFRELDEPDSFYGVEQESDLESIATRLDYEGDNIQSLLLRGAKMDSQQREHEFDHGQQAAAIIQSLGKLGLNSITSSLASTQRQAAISNTVMDSMINSAMKLRQWDVTVPSSGITTEGLVYRTFQSIHGLKDLGKAHNAVNEGLHEILKGIAADKSAGPAISSSFRALSALTEVNDMLASQGYEQFLETWQRLQRRDSWIGDSRPENASLLLTCRESFCGIVSHAAVLKDSLRISARDSRLLEIYVNMNAAETHRKLGSLQESLSSVTYLSSLIVPSAEKFGLQFSASVRKETAEILWERGELVASIKTLQSIINGPDSEAEAVPVGAAGLLADIAHRVSYARLEKPDDILNNYLKPALKQLREVRKGPEAGKVFHEYATYCHNQLENPDGIEELHRSERFKRQRTAELRDLKSAITTSKNDKERTAAKKEYENVKRWLRIDEQESRRLRDAREHFLKSSLEHYLRSLGACDEYDTNVIRFLAIWMGNSEHATANTPVKDYQSRVPSKKFAPLMNQLGSRLQETDNHFQRILVEIIMRVCEDHPYHGMYHIFAGSETSGGNDSQALSRKEAASVIAKRLQKHPKRNAVWVSVHKSNELYNAMAKLKSDEAKQGAKLTMKQFEQTKAVEREVPKLKVPPITMTINIRDDCNYSEVPTVAGFKPEITIPSGISAPKIITAVASNGVRYRQLFKGGTDDLRQDAIMEQVFEQVTALLKKNKSTRQRGLSVRTYKVVPLDATSGAIEFVDPTMSLNDFLLDAHHRYNPRDLKWRACRDKMSAVADLDLAARLKEYANIKSRFSPVLRHFFFERFENPDDWFERRLAYTRSTAAISILGHVLGLGDRHCQNILLDTHTGEVVHIDLGVAFEAGRILPKPETVPFRLTRDVVDGFGILKTEGVFRRCCEFTLEALRQNKDTILTLLNVLRYDPLYSWSVSPLRAKRLQNEQESRILEGKAGSVTIGSRAASRRSSAAAQEGVNSEAEFLREKRKEDEGGEADRALSTVEKKLAAGLSVSATVNELIQQATDDKNLAVLFHGWAPYA